MNELLKGLGHEELDRLSAEVLVRLGGAAARRADAAGEPMPGGNTHGAKRESDAGGMKKISESEGFDAPAGARREFASADYVNTGFDGVYDHDDYGGRIFESADLSPAKLRELASDTEKVSAQRRQALVGYEEYGRKARGFSGAPDDETAYLGDAHGRFFGAEAMRSAAMTEVSDFFRRDARRYDGGYDRY